MAAFNYITFERECPRCRASVALRAQTHIASDYDGDRDGRLMNCDYRLGQRMRWFDPSEVADFEDWMTWGPPPVGEAVTEECRADCPACGARLTAVIEFEDVTPTRVVTLRERR